jgi:hypothetical protein
MPDTFSSVWIHYVFSTKNRESWLVPAVGASPWPYFGAIAHQCDSMPKCIGGVSDHVHLLLSASKNLDTVAYISSQEEHHRTKSFREEYVGFLRKHGYPEHLLTAPFTRPSGTGADLKSYETGAEAPAYFLSAPPGRGV